VSHEKSRLTPDGLNPLEKFRDTDVYDITTIASIDTRQLISIGGSPGVFEANSQIH
jgi:hypothetical protein